MMIGEMSYMVVNKGAEAYNMLANAGAISITLSAVKDGVLVEAFKNNIFPYMIEIGTIVVVVHIVKSGYTHARTPNLQKLLDDLKNYAIAYGCIRGAFQILGVINKIIDGIK